MIQWLLKEESGQAMVEYALGIAFVAILLVGALTGIGNALSDSFQKAADSIP